MLAVVLSSLQPTVASSREAPTISWNSPVSGNAVVRRPALTAEGDTGARAYLDAARDSLTDLGAPSMSQAAADGSIEYTTPAGSLDSTPGGDVITSRFVLRSDFDPDLSLRYYRGYDFTIRGRSGAGGQVLWTYADKAAYAYAMPMRQPTGDGVLVAAYEVNYVNGSVAYAWAYSLKLTALDRTGATVWTKTFAGPYSHVNFAGGGGAALPIFRGLFDAVAGPTDDILVDSVDSARSSRAGQHPVRVEASVLNGATGDLASRAFRTVNNADYYIEPFVIPVGDLDGDGLDDCLFVLQASVDAPAALSASKGSDGTELWSTGAVSFGGGIAIAGLGDATADGADDLAVSNFAAAPQPGVFLLSGRTGAVTWSGPGSGGYPIGDATGDGRPDMGLVEYVWDGSTVSARLAAVTGTGAVKYSETYSVADLEGAQSLSGLVEIAGDTNLDDADDLSLRLSGTVDGVTRSLHVLVSGATGLAARELDGESVFGASTDADGTDFINVSPREGGGVTLTITDGRTGDERWVAPLAEGKDVQTTQLYPDDLDGDGRAELLANAMGSAGTVFHLLSSDGSVIWTA